MKKIYIFLSICLSHFGSLTAQTVDVEIPIIREFVYEDDYPMGRNVPPNRFAIGRSGLIVALPYSGIEQGYESSAVAYISQALYPHFGSAVSCVSITGINPGGESKGLIYLYSGELANNEDLRVMRFITSENDIAMVAHVPEGVIGEERLTFGMEYNTYLGMVNFLITVPASTIEHSYSIRKVASGDFFSWPVVATIPADWSYNAGVIPSGVISVDASSLDNGEYILVNDTFFASASNVVMVNKTTSDPREMWLERAGESSEERTYTLNKNGETYTIITHVPKGSDISLLRSILREPRYSVNGLNFSLVSAINRANDIELIFQISCPSGGSTQRVLTTGFSDRILPDIPNRFVMPAGGTNETDVWLESDRIVVTNTDPSTTYVLSLMGTSILFKGGNGGEVVFPIDPSLAEIKDYTVYYNVGKIDTNGYTKIGRSMNYNDPSLFWTITHLYNDYSTSVEFGPNDYTRTISFDKLTEFLPSLLEEVLDELNKSTTEPQGIIYELAGFSHCSCSIRIKVPYNLGAEYTFSNPVFWNQNFSPLEMNVRTGNPLQTFTVSGTWNDAERSNFNVWLSGSQRGINYSLVKIKEYPTTETIDVVVEQKIGTGDVLAFSNIRQKGVYKIIVFNSDNTKTEMSGMAEMHDISQQFVDNTNWVKTTSFRDATGSMYDQSITHYDGLGRPVQSVGIGSGGNGNDVVAIVEYDNMGRADTKTYLPYTRPSAGQQMSRLGVAEQKTYYSETKFPGDPDAARPYSTKQYDNTSTALVTRVNGVGSSSTVPIQYESRLNVAGDLIKKFTIGPDGVSLVYTNVSYPAGLLVVAKVSRPTLPVEQLAESYTYTNTLGQVIAEETRAGADRRVTYYVYDELGRQRYVIPPIQDDLIRYTQSQLPVTIQWSSLSRYSYYSEYDDHGRVVKQYVPGAKPVMTLYDKRGRVAMTQNGNQGGVNQWTFTKYDIHDRPLMTGLVAGGTYESHRAALDMETVFGETRGTAIHGYTNYTYPVVDGANDILTVAYYDDYAWLTGNTYAFSAADALDTEVNTTNIAGLQTGTKTKVLGITGHQWLTSVTYYNSRYQSIQSISDLYPQGKEVVANVHNFVGMVIQTRVKQTVGTKSYGYSKWFNFDDRGRLSNIQQQVIGDTNLVTVAAYTYDDMGNVSEKKIHNGQETTSYTRDLPGRLVGVNSPSFSYNLWFDKVPTGMTGRNDGNLAHVTWGSNSAGNHKGYTFAYDNFGQMTSAKYLQPSGSSWAATTKFSEQGVTSGGIQYDKNGNIRSLLRTNATGSTLHKLEYNYDNATNGNALSTIRINDAAVNTLIAFTYDDNGNMTKDGQSGVQIDYNVLNRPQRVSKGNQEIKYIYSADGVKLATVAADGSLTYYRSVFTYAKAAGSSTEELQQIMQPEGIVRKESNAWTYMYLKTDHLGSTRALLAAREIGGLTRLVTEQTTDYYPFGLAHSTLNNLQLNKYLYGGKEYQDGTLGGEHLGLYDFHARFYNPVYGRWFNMDPALQFANPYLYCANNPVMFIDPNGEFLPVGLDPIGTVFTALAMAYMGGVQANFMESAENNKNPFNPKNWNWKSADTYIGIVTGALMGANMNGFNFSTQIAGAIPNGLLQAGIQVTLNGLGNVTEDRKFFDNWYIPAASSFLTGAATGFDMAKSSGRQPYTGSKNYKYRGLKHVTLDRVTVYGTRNSDGSYKLDDNWLQQVRRNQAQFSNIDNYQSILMVRGIHNAHKRFLMGSARIAFSSAEMAGEGLFWTGAALSSTGIGASIGAPMAGLGKGLSKIGTLGNIGLDILGGHYKKALTEGTVSALFNGVSRLGRKVDGAEVIMNAIVSPFEYATGHALNNIVY